MSAGPSGVSTSYSPQKIIESVLPFLLPKSCRPRLGKMAFSGGYVGGSLGYSTNATNINYATGARYDALAGTMPSSDVSENASFFRARPSGGVNAGFGLRVVDALYLGLRLGLDTSSFQANGPVTGTNSIVDAPCSQPEFGVTMCSDIRSKTNSVEFSLDFKPGLVLGERAMFFVIAGAGFNRITVDQTACLVFNDSATHAYTSEVSLRGQQHVAALRRGFGIEQMINERVSLTVTYIYTTYRDVSGNGTADTITNMGDIPNGLNSNFTAQLRKQATTANLAYYF